MTETRARNALSSASTSWATASKSVAILSRWPKASSNSASSSDAGERSSLPSLGLFGLMCGVQAALPMGLKHTKAPLSFVKERCTMLVRWKMLLLVSCTSRCNALCCNSKRSARFEINSARLRSASALSRSNCTSMPAASCARSSATRASVSVSFCFNSTCSSSPTGASQRDEVPCRRAAALLLVAGRPDTSSRQVSSNSDISGLVRSCTRNSLRILPTEWSRRNCRMTVATISDSNNMRSCNCERNSRFSSINFLFVSRMQARRKSLVSGSR
mmetsp:Transcript_33109/g.95071  ORF Transcript_33109/g.95071 Transcript_33109/m.95071 type:complete len:273 (-) Transcript_33109:479-1297(-)